MRRPSRRQVLEGAAALAVAGCGQQRGRDPRDPGDALPARPHIIYIYVDQLRWDAPGFAGNPVAVTPNLDALAAESVQFSAAITNGPSCRAARATMISGQHVYEHGVWTNTVMPDPAMPSHVRRIRDEAGYHAMVIGKTHLHDGRGHFDDHKDVLLAFGFSDAIELPDPQQWQLRSAHSDFLTATTSAGDVDKYQRWQDYIRAYHWDSAPPDASPWRLDTEDHLDTFCGVTAADYVRSYGGDAPLYLQVCFPGPHKPFDPTSEFLARIDPNDPRMPLPVLVPPQEPIAPLVARYLGPKFETWDEPSARLLRAHYYAKVAMVDAGIGSVVQALKDAGLYDDAWVIVHSDHGELVADHSMTGKVLSYQGAVRVPLLVKPPGGVEAWEDRGQVDQRDVTATLLALAGLDPTGYGDRDLTPRVLGGPDGPEAQSEKPVMFENLGTVGIHDGVFTMSWDLAAGHPVELYDRSADPGEIDNRVFDPELRPELDRLVDVLRSLRPLTVDDWS